MSLSLQKKRIDTISFFLISICFFLILIIPTAFAGLGEEAKSNLYEMASTVGESIVVPISEALSSELYTNFAGGDFSSVESIETIYNSVKAIAGFLVMIIAMSHLIVNVDKGIDPIECIFKFFIEFGITCIFIMNLDVVVNVILELGSWFVRMITVGEVDESTIDGSAFLIQMTGADSGGLGWYFMAFAGLMVPWLLSFISSIAAKFLIYQIIIEIAVRKAFLPLAIVDIYQEGVRSSGVRYMKKLLAAFLKLALCALVATFTSVLFSNAYQLNEGIHPFKVIAEVAIANFTILGFMFKTGEIANDILGV